MKFQKSRHDAKYANYSKDNIKTPTSSIAAGNIKRYQAMRDAKRDCHRQITQT